MVEGGSLENCFTGIPGNVGSNPTSSASSLSSSDGAFSFLWNPNNGRRDSNRKVEIR